MKRVTTTKQFSDVLSSNLLQVAKAEVHYKTSKKTNIITDSFLENFQFLCESGCFMDCVGWHYERDYRTGDYIIETGRMDGNSENIIIAHLSVCDDANIEDIERILKIVEE
jgi:hypothetical protein